MKISEVGESRIRGYLFVLERSLRTFLPREVVADAAREVESHIRERLDQIVQTTPLPDERANVERVLRELGPPLKVAQAYSLEMTVDEAVATGRVIPMARAFLHVATTTVGGFLAAVIVLWGYAASAILFSAAILESSVRATSCSPFSTSCRSSGSAIPRFRRGSTRVGIG